MRTTVTAVIFSIFASAAAAQCVTQAQAQAQAQAPAAGAAQPQLIRTAAAATRQQALAPDDGLGVTRQTAAAAKNPEKEYPRRAGPGMLLAALALMSGIALRRFSAGMK